MSHHIQCSALLLSCKYWYCLLALLPSYLERTRCAITPISPQAWFYSVRFCYVVPPSISVFHKVRCLQGHRRSIKRLESWAAPGGLSIYTSKYLYSANWPWDPQIIEGALAQPATIIVYLYFEMYVYDLHLQNNALCRPQDRAKTIIMYVCHPSC